MKVDISRTLAYNYVFRGLPRHVVAGIAALTEVREYRGGDVLVRQFEHGNELMILLEGSARIQSYREDPIAEFGPGSMIGEMALVDDQPRSATVVCVGPCTIAVIPAKVIRDMMAIDPKTEAIINANIAKVVVRRLRSMNARLESSREATPALRAG